MNFLKLAVNILFLLIIGKGGGAFGNSTPILPVWNI